MRMDDSVPPNTSHQAEHVDQILLGCRECSGTLHDREALEPHGAADKGTALSPKICFKLERCGQDNWFTNVELGWVVHTILELPRYLCDNIAVVALCSKTEQSQHSDPGLTHHVLHASY